MKSVNEDRTLTRSDARPGAVYGVYILALAICGIGNLAIRIGERHEWMSQPFRVVLAVATILPLIVTVGLFWRMLKGNLDEMQQRIVLEGMAFALVLYIPLAGLYVNLRTAGAWTPRLDAPDIIFAPALLVALGIALAWRRYR